jgi:hypothetical protein
VRQGLSAGQHIVGRAGDDGRWNIGLVERPEFELKGGLSKAMTEG